MSVSKVVGCIGIDFSASLEASSLSRGSRSIDLRQLKRRGTTAARDAAAPLRLPQWRTNPVTVWGAGGRRSKVAAMGMSRSWRGGGVLPPARQGALHRSVGAIQRGVLVPARFPARRWRRPPPLCPGWLRSPSRALPSLSVWPWFLCCLPNNGSLGAATMQVAVQLRPSAHFPHPRAPHQPAFASCFTY